MAIFRQSLRQMGEVILRNMAFANSSQAPWRTNEKLYQAINEYGQRLPMRLDAVAQNLVTSGMVPVSDLPIKFQCWRTATTSGTSTTTGIQVTNATALIYMPVDFDSYWSFYDTVQKKHIPVIDDPERFHADELVSATAGATKAIKIMGFGTDGSGNWRRMAYLYPTPTGTPSLNLDYFRLPAEMPGADPENEYADIDPKYESLYIWGTTADLSRSTGFEYDRYAQEETQLLTEMCLTARVSRRQ